MSYANLIPDKLMTAAEIVRLAQTRAAQQQPSKVEKKETVKSQIIAYPVFDLSKSGVDLKAEEGVRMLVNTGAFESLAALPIFGSDKTRTFVWNQQPLRYSPDKLAFTALQTAGCNPALWRYATQCYRSNGTYRGLVARVCERITKPVSIDKNAHSEFVPAVKRMLPLGAVVVEEIELYPTVESKVLSQINASSCAGLPYMLVNSAVVKITDQTGLNMRLLDRDPDSVFGPMIPVVQHASELAVSLCSILEQARTPTEAVLAWNQLVDRAPWLNTFLLKRKDEVAPRDDFEKKCRPYGVQPLPSRFMCMTALAPVSSNMRNFEEDPESISAFRFSPYHGGGTRLVRHVVKRVRDVGHCALVYGDDQLWSFKLPSGRVLVMGPDVKGMDMSTTRHHVRRVVDYLRGMKLPGASWNLIAVWLYNAFNHRVAAGGAHILFKKDGLFSGIPGTTELNIISSAYIVAVVLKHVAGVKDDTEFFSGLSRAFVVVKAILNFEFKGGDPARVAKGDIGDIPHVFYNDVDQILSQGIRVPFLQMEYHPVKGREREFVARPADFAKFGGSLVLCARAAGMNEHAHRCARILGIWYSGAWQEETIRATLVKLYDSSYAFKGAADIVPEGVVGWQDALEASRLLGTKNLPSVNAMEAFNTDDKAAFIDQVKRGAAELPRTSAAESGKEEQGLDDVFDALVDDTGGAPPVELASKTSSSASAKKPVQATSAAAAATKLVDDLNADFASLFVPLPDALPAGTKLSAAANASVNTVRSKQLKLARAMKKWAERTLRREMARLDSNARMELRKRGYEDDDEFIELVINDDFVAGEYGDQVDALSKQYHDMMEEEKAWRDMNENLLDEGKISKREKEFRDRFAIDDLDGHGLADEGHMRRDE